MHSLIYSIALDDSKCVGCTNCIKKCPVEAIRVKNGKAKIIKDKCINCGQCLSVCPRHALYGVTDDFELLSEFSYNIALIDPAFYGQFDSNVSPSQILVAVKKCGFDHVFETSQGADIITEYTKNFISSSSKKPVISSSCPAIIRIIQIRFPELIPHILPIDSPVEISAYMAKQKAIDELGLKEEDIGVFYISTCPARVFSLKKPIGTKKSYVDGTLSIKSLFLMVSKGLEPTQESGGFYTSGKGIGWARVGGQSQALGLKEFLAVDGIENVINVLEEIENGKINDLDFLECQACTNGCVGGSFTVENSFVARNRIRRICQNYYHFTPNKMTIDYSRFIFTESISPLEVTKLDDDLFKAIQKMERIESVLKTLPNIDCGACGSPCCRSLAEDIVLDSAQREDCIVILKNILKNQLEDSNNFCILD